jgi:ribosome-binding factor A
MLAGKRAVRVGDQILRGVADLLMHKVKDPRIKGVTLTGIDLSNDLKYARIFFSIIGNQDEVMKAKSGLDSAKGYIKREIGLRSELRYVPDVSFVHDPTLDTGERMERLFERLRVEDSGESPE